MVWIAAAVGIGTALFGASEKKKAAKKASQANAQGVSDALANTNFKSSYSPGGAAAFSQANTLLGVDPGAAAQVDPATGQPIAGTSGAEKSQAGFQNYLNSAGYKTQLNSGIDALNSNAAARGLLKSGATLKATQRFGAGLGQQYFNNYISQLNQQAGIGVQSDAALANIYTGGSVGAQKAAYSAGDAGAEAASGIGKNIAGALGDMRGAPKQPTGVQPVATGPMPAAPIMKT